MPQLILCVEDELYFRFFFIKSVFTGLQKVMLLTFSEVHDGGDFAACGPWTIATKIYPFYMVRVAAKRANPLAFI